MFWTRFVRGWNKFFLTVIIIASVVVGIVFADETGLLSLLLIPITALLGFATVAVIMMISEISVSLNEINKKLGETGTISAEANVGAVSSERTQETERKNTPIISAGTVGKNSNDSWLCDCGARNPHMAAFCAQCGKPRSK